MSFLVGEVYAIMAGDSNMRGLLALMEFISWGNGGWDAARLGFPCVFAYVLSALSLVGLVINLYEPGILTKDHDTTTTSSTKKSK